jgi:hypothetical protein
MPTATERLTAFLREQPAIPVPHRGKDDPRPAIAAGLALAEVRPAVHALLSTLVTRDTQFALFDIELYPAVLARTPWREGVMTPRELCVAKNGAGDLYLWNVDDDSVRLVIHDEDWEVRTRSRSFDVFVEGAMWTCLELLQVEELDELDEVHRARIRFAADLVGRDPIDAEVLARLVELGVLAG